MFSTEAQVSPCLSPPDGRPLNDLPNLECLPNLFAHAIQRPHDLREEEEEENHEGDDGMVVENTEPPLVYNTDEEPSMNKDLVPPPLGWDDIRMSDSDEEDYENIKLDDLLLNDDEVGTDNEETNCPGKKYPMDKHLIVDKIWGYQHYLQGEKYCQQREEIVERGDENAKLPPFPLLVFPEVTGRCILKDYCHHREFRTHDTSTTDSTIGYGDPDIMLQVFSLCLSSSSESYPVSVYGIVAIRDDLEPLRNYVFNRPCRGDAVTIDQSSSTLPLCSPCRGIYMVDRALVEVDLWVKKEGDGSDDKQLLSAYAEIEVGCNIDWMLDGQICKDLCSLDIGFMIIQQSVEAVIQVFAKVDHPHHVRFTAFSGGIDREIVLFDDKLCGDKKLCQHVVAVKADEKLAVCLKTEESLFLWTFQDGHVGHLTSPVDSTLKYGKFDVRVLFAPKNGRYSDFI